MTALTFSPELIEKIKSGQKTQTRRPVQPDECETLTQSNKRKRRISLVCKNSRVKWTLHCTRAIKPGRTARGVGHVLIKDIRREAVTDISESDARAEGFASRDAFLAYWHKLYGDRGMNMDCWVLTFEVTA